MNHSAALIGDPASASEAVSVSVAAPWVGSEENETAEALGPARSTTSAAEDVGPQLPALSRPRTMIWCGPAAMPARSDVDNEPDATTGLDVKVPLNGRPVPAAPATSTNHSAAAMADPPVAVSSIATLIATGAAPFAGLGATTGRSASGPVVSGSGAALGLGLGSELGDGDGEGEGDGDGVRGMAAGAFISRRRCQRPTRK
jgi:hypothetical protein